MNHRLPMLALLLGLLSACSGGESTSTPPAANPDKPTLEVVAPPATGLVTLTAAGVKFDPPANKDQIPGGAWLCDMGAVHYAATEKHDGSCPICGMELSQQAAH